MKLPMAMNRPTTSPMHMLIGIANKAPIRIHLPTFSNEKDLPLRDGFTVGLGDGFGVIVGFGVALGL